MPEENENISSILSQYLRHELPPTRMAEIKHLITNDPAWKSTYITLTSTSQGIRHSTLTDLRNQLQSLEADIKKSENNGHSSGDLASHTTSIDESNEKSNLENTVHTPPDPMTIIGIRYTTLHDEFKKLKSEEKKLHTETSKKNETVGSGVKVVGMRKWWWAVAASALLVISIGYFILEQNKKPKYVNQYLLDHFDEYVLHDKVRGTATDTAWDRDKEIGYDLYVLQEFEEAIPYLKRRWERTGDTLALYYLYISNIALGKNEIANDILKNEHKFILKNKFKISE